jgi:hypothetical protein
MRALLVTCCGCLLLVTAAFAGPTLIDNAALETRFLDGDLDTFVETWSGSTGKSRWLGWHVPMAEGDQILCCGSFQGRRRQPTSCDLESSHRHFVFTSEKPASYMGSRNLIVLIRAQKGRLTDLHAYSEGCRLDAGGRQVLWLEGVDPAKSVGYLDGLIEAKEDVRDEALMALALHAAPQAVATLGRIARHYQDPDLRGEALFWLSQAGSPEASSIILDALAHDPDVDVREEAVFALSQLPEQEGIPLLLGIIQDRAQASGVREQAFFWYVQEGDDEALDLIAEILGN